MDGTAEGEKTEQAASLASTPGQTPAHKVLPKLHKWRFGMLIIFILVTIAGILLATKTSEFYSRLSSALVLLRLQDEQASSVFPIQTTTTRPITKTGWLTYRDTKFSFELSYPPDWLLTSIGDEKCVPFCAIVLHPRNRSGDNIALFIYPKSTNNLGLLDNPNFMGRHTVTPIQFADRAAREFHREIDGYYSHEIRIDDRKGLAWNEFNLIKYYAVPKEYASLLTIEQILETFHFVIQQPLE